MRNWKHKLEIADEWYATKQGKLSISELASVIAQKLDKLHYSDETIKDEKNELINAFETFAEGNNQDVEEFDSLMDWLYDWGDRILSGTYLSGTKVCWINTFK